MAHPRGIRGRKYRSKLESRVAGRLGKMNLDINYETQKLTYTKQYTPDFIINEGDPDEIILEVKGILRPEDRSKMVAVKRDNPNKDIRFIFQKPDSKMIGSKSTHAQWAKRNGFMYYGENEFKKRDFV